jgi:Flp pilus assembly protein TadG
MIMPRVPRRRQTSRGSTILELSFIFLIFFSLLMGAFDFGQFLFLHQALVERARSAARWALLTSPPPTNTEVQNMVLYGQSTAGTNGYFGLTSSTVTVTQSNANTWNWRISVLISNYPYKMFSPYIAGSYTGPNISVTVPLGMYD